MIAVHDLERFLEAQNPVYKQVCKELRAGRKTGHWIWFIFPQIKGLGQSSTSRYFAIGSSEEAQAYLAHPILGARLRECTEIVLRIEGRSSEEIFGVIDSMKFRSSMTLFSIAAGAGHPASDERALGNEVFQRALDKYFAGRQDFATLELLGHEQ